MSENPEDDITDLIAEYKGQTSTRKGAEDVPLAERVLTYTRAYSEDVQHSTFLVLRELGLTEKEAKVVAKKWSFVNMRLVHLYVKAHRDGFVTRLHRALSTLLDKVLKAL